MGSGCGRSQGFTDERIISLIRRANDSIPAATVEKPEKIKLWQAKRTKSCPALTLCSSGVEFILFRWRDRITAVTLLVEFYNSVKHINAIIVVKRRWVLEKQSVS